MNKWIIYLGLSIELTLLMMFLSGCLKEPDFTQNFGPEVSATEIQEALNTPMADPYRIEAGEYAYAERTTRIETLPETLVLQRADTVTKKDSDAQDWIFTINSTVSELKDGEMQTSTKEVVARLRKQNAPTTSEMRLLGSGGILPRADRITYHNLKRDEIILPVPDLVRARPDCGLLPTQYCQHGLPAVRLTYDRVDWEGDRGTRTGFLFVISPVVPYFASQIQGCAETAAPYQDQRVHVTQCETVRDFKFGPTTSSVAVP